jgi:hypothetical protein
MYMTVMVSYLSNWNRKMLKFTAIQCQAKLLLLLILKIFASMSTEEMYICHFLN